MNKKSLVPLVAILLTALLMSMVTTVFARQGASLALQSSLPQITFLGQGPQTFTVEPPLKLLVKTYQNGQFLFVAHDEQSYTAASNERVWTIDFVPTEPIRLFDEERSYGNVEAGCVVHYVQIEDNVDNRRNTFYINGNELQVVEQGWVTYGSFTVPETGELTFFAEDSIGMVIELCQSQQTVVPSESPTVAATTPAVPTSTSTAPGVVITPTVTETEVAASPTATVTLATATPTGTVPAGETESPTPTSTSTAPGVQITLTPTSTSTAPGVAITLTSTNTAPAGAPTSTITATVPVVQITATPIGTPSNLPVTGGAPGPREIAVIGASLLGLLLAVGAAWVFLLRAYLQRR